MTSILSAQTPTPCEVCHQKESIYRCPKCLVRTCCLSCCLSHKEKSGCDGKRDRTAFVPLHEFKDSTLRSDYYFLEDVLTKSNRGKRLIRDLGLDKHQRGNGGNKRKRTNEISNSERAESAPIHPLSQLKLNLKDQEKSLCAAAPNIDGSEDKKSPMSLVTIPFESSSNRAKESNPTLSQYPKQKQRLVQKAKERNINLLLMPPGMQRHIVNKTTKHDTKKDIIYWKVEFIFHQMLQGTEKESRNHEKVILTVDRIAENEQASTHLENVIERNVIHSGASNDTRSVLRAFVKAEYVTLMKKIPCALSQPLYNKVNLRSTMGVVLKGTSVIEFPTIEVILKKDLEHFPLVIQEM